MGFKSFLLQQKIHSLKSSRPVFAPYFYSIVFSFFLNEFWHGFDSNNLNCLSSKVYVKIKSEIYIFQF